MVKNRKEIENLVYDVMDALDPSGTNSAKYKELYGTMTDAQFEKHMKEFLKDPDENFIVEIDELHRKVTMQQCEKAAKVLNIPIEERVFMPHLSMNKSKTIASNQKCIVGWINIKRVQQMLAKKNGLALSDENVWHLTGQVINDDKNARDSDIEATMLVAMGADKILEELHGPRSDDTAMKRQMMNDIATKGHVVLDDLENLPTNKTTLNAVNTYLMGMQIKSNLISDSYVILPLGSNIVL